MPRLVPSFLRRAHAISPYLVPLLSVCRDLPSARNELRWIRQHVLSSVKSSQRRPDIECRVKSLCISRGRGAPLQYLLGSQPFGPLDIKCQPGVLIPRPETEAWVYYLTQIIRGQKNIFREEVNTEHPALHLVDLCSGTGCIPLLLASQLRSYFPKFDFHGYDISSVAVQLAQQNIQRNHHDVNSIQEEKAQTVHFHEADVFADRWKETLQESGFRSLRVDILVSNPPYISHQGFQQDTERSVRKFEPRLALVPDAALSARFPDVSLEDVFYARLLQLIDQLQPMMAVFEVGDLQQAIRVAQLALKRGRWKDIEIWRDWPNQTPSPDEEEAVAISGRTVKIRGSGNGRVVYLRPGRTAKAETLG